VRQLPHQGLGQADEPGAAHRRLPPGQRDLRRDPGTQPLGADAGPPLRGQLGLLERDGSRACAAAHAALTSSSSLIRSTRSASAPPGSRRPSIDTSPAMSSVVSVSMAEPYQLED
jgi:hypothetical protein